MGDAMAIRYPVDLIDTERAALREIISKNNAKRSTIINASILLKADRACGWTNADIALAYEVSTKKVEQRKKRCVEEGFEAVLSRKPVTKAHRRKITGDEEAHLIALCCSKAPDGYHTWTLRMLAEKMVALAIVDAVSHETVRRTLQKMHVNRGKRKHGVCLQSTMPPLSARGKKSEICIKNLMMHHILTCVWMQCRPN
jgi:transposase